MFVKTAIELHLLKTTVKLVPGGLLSDSDLVAQVPNVNNHEASMMLDRFYTVVVDKIYFLQPKSNILGDIHAVLRNIYIPRYYH
ncbi:O-methyltransferase COMT-type, S-adenosyl-L-methionine-dependent methyltransferase [Artemisia annua]|uniref:O-methyltransferase COMT-type, S-adenosyl-L-methionine-dependent methyltransferase n=1 Tax=Artemisia annua TaxID=35608 RepID=A0A2U1NES1_ARTAN|nr:O-methyltransferase COMT-type, S-adenosyl-L-methionine-dependent methyltransferase [Artemisia annua]PWA75563.1 O-methyltransferase COMT-type, S-adenosyl-L-methionine-dependent methyltransferase [Artemisia annua]